jgi:hypothetical protein
MSDKPTIEEAFQEYHKKYPEVYVELVRFARQVKNRGFKKYSINACFERVRWYFDIERTTGEAFKINNNFRSRYVRLIMENEPDLDGFFETRELKAD